MFVKHVTERCANYGHISDTHINTCASQSSRKKRFRNRDLVSVGVCFAVKSSHFLQA